MSYTIANNIMLFPLSMERNTLQSCLSMLHTWELSLRSPSLIVCFRFPLKCNTVQRPREDVSGYQEVNKIKDKKGNHLNSARHFFPSLFYYDTFFLSLFGSSTVVLKKQKVTHTH